MGLGIHGEASALHAFDQVEFPHGPFPVHQVGVLGGYQCQQLTNPPWLWQCFMAEMMLQIEMIVLFPEILAKAVYQLLVERAFRCLKGPQ